VPGAKTEIHRVRDYHGIGQEEKIKFENAERDALPGVILKRGGKIRFTKEVKYLSSSYGSVWEG